MRTVCPSCQTVFRVSPAQLRARAGRVRCGHCAAAFNALEQLVEDDVSPRQPATADLVMTSTESTTGDQGPQRSVDVSTPEAAPGEEMVAAIAPPDAIPRTQEAVVVPEVAAPAVEPTTSAADIETRSVISAEPSGPSDDDADAIALPASDSSAEADAGVTALSATVDSPEKPLSGETREVTDYRRWVSGSNGTPVPIADRRPYRQLYVLTALLLLLALIGQLLFHFRTPLGVAFPALWPTLTTLSGALGTDMPLSRHIEQISIESSDLQIERGPNRTLALQATLRNRADYPQAYPALELTLTDVNETVLVRRVLLPNEYLAPPVADDQSFPARADLDVRLWLAAKEVDSAGYRLYVFYP